MPYLKDKTRILDVWLNGYASKRFTVISQWINYKTQNNRLVSTGCFCF
jgi:hypothetical protein